MSKKNVAAVLKSVDTYKPTISFSAKELPAIKDMKMKSKHTLTVSVEVVGLSDDDYDDGMTARFKVSKVKLDK